MCFALSIAARSVLGIYRPILEPMGLTHPQYLVMLALWGQSPLAVKELIEMLQLDGPTLSPMLKRLEAAGLVTRTRDPGDERQLRIDLTEQGRALREQALNVPPAVVAKLGMSLGDLMEVHKGLTELNEAARRAGVEPTARARRRKHLAGPGREKTTMSSNLTLIVVLVSVFHVGVMILMIWIRVRRTEGDGIPTASPKVTPCALCGEPATDWSYDGLDPNEQLDPHSGRVWSADATHYRPLCAAH